MVQITAQPLAPVALNDCRLPVSRSLAPAPTTPAVLTVAPPDDAPAPARRRLAALRPHPALRTLPLDAEHVAAFVPSVSQVAVLNRAAQALLAALPLSDAAQAEEALGAIAALDRLGLLADTADAAPQPPAPHPVLSAWLHVTNQCNLRCTYCYIAKDHTAMDEPTALAAVEAVFRAAAANGYREVALKYAGGEPLLALDTVAKMHRRARELAAAAGIALQASVLSNGVSVDERAVAALRALGLGLTISLDGPAPANDAQRPTLGGGPSALRAMRGIATAIAGGLSPAVAVTVTGASAAGLPELAGWLLERGVPFTVSLARDGACGGDRAALLRDEEQIVAGLRALYAQVERNPPPWSVLGALLDRTDLSQPHSHACAAGEHYLVIDQHGNVAKCQMTIREAVSSVRAADPLLELRLSPAGLRNLPVDEREGCASCEWRYWCGGGCPIATFRATGRFDVKSPNCNIYKALYPDLIRLEGRRLLALAGVS
jgi:uncharacterized protein